MSEPEQAPSAVPTAPPEPPAKTGSGPRRDFRFALRRGIPTWQAVCVGILCLCSCLALWWFVTRGAQDERILPRSKGLSSPAETFASFPDLWFKQALTRNLLTTLRRLSLGFGLAALVGVPLGVLCGCFPRVNAFFMPLTLFGRNIPVAALIPLTFALFGIDETQKVVFIFIACVAFVLWDTARAFEEVGGEYIDTAYTLGAGTWQTIGKVLLPLALPSVFNSLRLLFGLAFGYIMLAEVVKLGGETGGVGDLINVSQRRGQIENVILILLIIPVVALIIDRLFFFVQVELFPYRYGGMGILHRAVGGVLHAWEDFRLAIWSILSRLFGRRTAPSPSTDASAP